MNDVKGYISVIGIGILFSIINEIILSHNKNFLNRTTLFGNIIRLVFLNIYVYILLLITLFLQWLGKKRVKELLSSKEGNLLIFIFLFLFISIFECIVGNISLIYYSTQTWKYKPNYLTLCKGYVSVVSSLYFTAVLYVFIKFIYPKLFM